MILYACTACAILRLNVSVAEGPSWKTKNGRFFVFQLVLLYVNWKTRLISAKRQIN